MESAVKIVMFVVLVGIVICIPAFLVMLLWNWLVPSITGWSEIGFWHAYGLLILCSLLFGRSES